MEGTQPRGHRLAALACMGLTQQHKHIGHTLRVPWAGGEGSQANIPSVPPLSALVRGSLMLS